MLSSRDWCVTFGGDVSATESLRNDKVHVVGHGARVYSVSNAAHIWNLCKFCSTKSTLSRLQ